LGADVRSAQCDEREIAFAFLDPGVNAGHLDPGDGAESAADRDQADGVN
jgi:hypothetical protein